METTGKKKPFYGWVIVGAAWLIYLFNVAFPMYGGSVLNSVMVLDTGLSTSALGYAVTLHTALVGVAGPIAGYIIHKKGFRATYILGSILIICAAIGYLFFPMTPVTLTLYFGVLAALGIGVGGTLCTQSLVIQWFEKNQAMALALALTAGAVGGFVGPILMNAANEIGGWKTGWALCAICAVISIFLALFFIKDKPEDIGEVKDGHAFHANEAKKPKSAEKTVPLSTYNLTLKDALKTKEFYIFVIASAVRTALYYSVLGYAVVYAVESGISKSAAALVVSSISITSLAGRLLTGVLGKAGVPVKIILLMASFGMALCGLLLFVGGSFPVFIITGMGAGFGFGISMVVTPMFFSHYFGPENFSVIYGTMMPISTIFGSLGPSATGTLALTLGGYQLPFLGLGLLNVLAALLCLVLSMPRQRIPS